MLNREKTDKSAVFAAENSMAETFKDQYGLDAAPGSATRELAIRPAAVLRSMEEDWRAALTSSLNMFRIASGDVAGEDDLVDAVASIYGVVRHGGSASVGTMMIEVAEQPTVYVNGSLSFSIGSVRLSVPGLYVGHSNDMPDDAADGVHHVKIRRYAKGVDTDGNVEYSYCMLVPVYCESGENFPAGTEITVTGPAGGIIGCTVFSAITGGGEGESNQALAKRVLEGLPPGVMSTPLQIKNTLSDQFGIPPARTAVLGALDGTPRSKDPVTGLPVPGTADICVAPEGDCPVETVEATPVSAGNGSWTLTFTPDVVSGVYDVTAVQVGGTAVQDYTVSYSVDESTIHVINEHCYRFSAYQSMTVAFTSQEDISSSTAYVTVRRQPSVAAIQGYVDSSDLRAPGQDTVVYAASPVFLRLSLSVDGADVSDATLRTTLCNHINSLPVGRGYVSGQDCFDALNPIGVKVVFPITMYAHVITDTGVFDIMSVNGRLDYGKYTKGRDAVYISATDVRVTAG